ncbi:TPA: hypothetical protein ACKP7A_002510 [Serratia liquefaciens]|uniref:hypothetical protein n=1 Tax=Serratia liquefaciens TaxID=614 RepID=UPI00101EE6D5|nr:hypothetical protein [Serratia liquefaciens]MDU4174980.1 hypothetical protein [Serratia liquefaciens]RYM70841.1 hypothetical protein BSQ99_12730 [Serratia liquefaciens]HEJ7885128.1 hypothetical protein [Serratia liquefaciens]
MNRFHREAEALWFNTRNLSQRTGTEAEKFADECWAKGLRLAASQANHYQHIMEVVRSSLTDR